jgi:hypothetical protein
VFIHIVTCRLRGETAEPERRQLLRNGSVNKSPYKRICAHNNGRPVEGGVFYGFRPETGFYFNGGQAYYRSSA